jgi:kinetochore protein Spc7/SPC105
VQRLSDYWSSCTQLRSQLKLLTIKFPVEIEVFQKSSKEPPAFKAKVMILFPAVKSKAFVSFVFTPKTFCCWPMSIDLLQYEVEVAYGAIE